jgi:hypothetical protein
MDSGKNDLGKPCPGNDLLMRVAVPSNGGQALGDVLSGTDLRTAEELADLLRATPGLLDKVFGD